jgi:hypothetical protein
MSLSQTNTLSRTHSISLTLSHTLSLSHSSSLPVVLALEPARANVSTVQGSEGGRKRCLAGETAVTRPRNCTGNRATWFPTKRGKPRFDPQPGTCVTHPANSARKKRHACPQPLVPTPQLPRQNKAKHGVPTLKAARLEIFQR